MTNKLFLSTPSDGNQGAEVIPLARNTEQIQHIFDEIERELPFCDDDSLCRMLTFAQNLQVPIHRWYHFKEGYSHHLVTEIIKCYPPPSNCPAILDPFCGAGTTLLVAQNHELPAVGVEINPFAAFLSRVKTEWYKIDPDELEKVLKRVLQDTNPARSAVPELTTFHNEKYFPNRQAYELVRLKDAIRRRKATPEVKNVLILALMATLEDVSCLQKDGRLLRYMPRDVIPPQEALSNRARIILEDLQATTTQPHHKAKVLQGDARNLDFLSFYNTLPHKFGLIIYSPPYPNNFDYSEIYKCELWLTGFIKSYKQWLQLRRRTFRSHPSCKFPETYFLRETPILREVYRLVEQAAKCPDIGEKRAKQRAPKVIRGYFDDVFLILKEQIVKLVPGGYIVCVVGNSKHGNLHIPADTLIAKIGQALGLELVEIRIAKYRLSRNQQSQKLRESLVVFRKP